MAAAALCSAPSLRQTRAACTTRWPSGMRLAPLMRAQSCSNGALQRRNPRYGLIMPSGAFGGMAQKALELRPAVQLMREMEELSQAFELPSASGFSAEARALACDLVDCGDHLELQADVPGVAKEDIKVTVSPDNVLTISGERKYEREEGKPHKRALRVERSFGSFQRKFLLSDTVDPEGIKAAVKDGVLRLSIPKVQLPQPRTIQVQLQDELPQHEAAPAPAVPEAAAEPAAAQAEVSSSPEAPTETPQE